VTDLDFDTALEVLNAFGYTSTNDPPYIYEKGDDLGVCYAYIDAEFGLLSRVRIFKTKEDLEEFLKEIDWIRDNGLYYNARMILDNYESTFPKVLYLRNDKIMVAGEMYNIEEIDFNLRNRENLDEVTQMLYAAGDLLMVYDEVKARQLDYLQNLNTLKNSLRRKYFDLQHEVDVYNKIKVDRHLTLLPDVQDTGINLSLEIATKDQYNMYLSDLPTLDEAKEFLRQTWDLNMSLDSNSKYYLAQVEDNNIRNEIKIVDEKLNLMKELNADVRPMFGMDLIGQFRDINKKYMSINNAISTQYVSSRLEDVEKKYAMFELLDPLHASDYLRETVQSTNYADLANKYSLANSRFLKYSKRLPLHDIAANLSTQYKSKLDINEQSILVLYNNLQYRVFFDAILNIEDFDKLPLKKILKAINKVPKFSKIKSAIYYAVKKRIDEPINASIKNSLFNGIDFTSFQSFVTSFIPYLVKLKNLNSKMTLNSDMNMYAVIDNSNDILGKKFITVSSDLNSLYIIARENKKIIASCLLKKDLPVLYSPYIFDMGDIYSKNASLQMFIKEKIDFELLLDCGDVLVNINSGLNVVQYIPVTENIDNIVLVNDMRAASKTYFCRYVFISNVMPSTVLAPTVSPVGETANPSNSLASVSLQEQVVEICKSISFNSKLRDYYSTENDRGAIKVLARESLLVRSGDTFIAGRKIERQKVDYNHDDVRNDNKEPKDKIVTKKVMINGKVVERQVVTKQVMVNGKMVTKQFIVKNGALPGKSNQLDRKVTKVVDKDKVKDTGTKVSANDEGVTKVVAKKSGTITSGNAKVVKPTPVVKNVNKNQGKIVTKKVMINGKVEERQVVTKQVMVDGKMVTKQFLVKKADNKEKIDTANKGNKVVLGDDKSKTSVKDDKNK